MLIFVHHKSSQMRHNSLKKVLLTFSFVLLSLSCSWAQGNPLPSDHPVNTAAAHLPALLQHDEMFNGLKYSVYITEEDKATLKTWATTYPEELKKYKAAITNYLNSVKVESLSADGQLFYDNLEAQMPLLDSLGS